MKKIPKILTLVLFFLSFLPFGSVEAVLFADFKNQEAPSDYFYPQEFDNLVLDISIPSGNIGTDDKLKAITVQNMGTARDFYDIEKIKLWSDSGPLGFQGMAVDKELGTFTFDGQNNNWYLNNLSELVPATGLRIFISVDIYKYATAYRFFQIQTPKLYDRNSDGIFALGDFGIFMESKNNGPIDQEIINPYSQEIRTFVIDNLSPKTVITDPKDGTKITTSSYIIKGVAKDQGSSTPAWVQLGINNTWYDVTATDSNYLTWEYSWESIREGTYKLQTKSADWEDPRDGGVITVIKETPVVQPPSEAPPAVTPPAEKPISEMTIEELEAKIVEIQQKIIELLKQLIQLIQQQIAELRV